MVDRTNLTMASCSVVFSFLLLLSLPMSDAHLSRTTLFLSPDLEQQQKPTSLRPFDPITFFEVARPVDLPDAESCSALLLRHDFGYTYGLPPVLANYTPPSNCRHGDKLRRPRRIVLRFSATSQGRQFDRLIGVWLGGAEVLRSCTAEPRAAGIFLAVEKDVTRYASLFAQPQTLAVYIGNVIDSTYTGVYHVNISAHWYFDKDSGGQHQRSPIPGFSSPADLILPVSRSLPLNDGLWFRVQNLTDVQTKALAVPRNSYRAVLEVYVAPQADDEFWYTNPPNSYIEKNNLTDVPGNGAFREVTVQLDGKVVGAVWPFTVFYTGGINPLLWMPISAIGSFNFPSYDIEITPFLGKILDGEPHEFGFGVTDALSMWYVNANLHLWLDTKSSQTVGSLVKYEAPEFAPSLVSQFKGLDGSFKTSASRQISSTGWVNSSFGNITTHFFQKLEFENLMEFLEDRSTQVVNQTIQSSYGTYAKQSSSMFYSEQVFQKFPLHLYIPTHSVMGLSSYVSNVSLGFNETRFSGDRFGLPHSSLNNEQAAQGSIRVDDNLVVTGLASTQQLYKYESIDGCYFRNVSSSNDTILHDKTVETCTKKWPLLSENFLS